MKAYIVQYRIGINGKLYAPIHIRAKTPAGAIAQVARILGDIDGQLSIIATPE